VLYLSVVVPAYREEKRIGRCIRVVVSYFRGRRRPFELIVVNDGSLDGTLAEARKAARGRREVRIMGYARNRGKGFALRKGMLAARGSRLLFLDADLATMPDEWPKLERCLDAGADVAIGSRKMAGAKLVKRQPWWRERMGKGFSRIVRTIFVPVNGATCGFKAFSRHAARYLFSRAVINDFSYDAEILFIAARMGMRIDERPVVWRNNPDSTVRLVRDTFNSLRGLFRMSLNHLIGRYGRPRIG
jgi:dolichyl-phosphate beta-glucosyltransferase